MCTSPFVRVRKSKIMQSAVCVNFKVCTDLENRPAGDAALEVGHILAGLVHVEGPPRGRGQKDSDCGGDV